MSGARRALITGISGQDGWYLSRYLGLAGYEVLGTSRQASPGQGVDPTLIHLDRFDTARFRRLLSDFRPHELYNFASRSSGAGMYDDATEIGETNGLDVARLLEAVREVSPSTRVLQASSSEVFGDPRSEPQSETTARNPRSPYGAAKMYADAMVAIYRERYGLFGCSAILFNHESPRRPEIYVTRKVSRAVARIKLGLQDDLHLGDLDARRDWGFAGDYVEGMWAMLQQDAPDDYVLATGDTHSVRDLCEVAFSHVGLDYRQFVRSSEAARRPREAGQLVGDASKARAELAWHPRVSFEHLVAMMVDADMSTEKGVVNPGESP